MARSSILNMFARSPVRPLQRHMEQAHACAELLPAFFEAVLAQNWQQAETLRSQISDLEREADVLKMDFRLHLPKSLLLPVPRSDLLSLLAKQEKIANTVKDIAGIIIGRKMQIPSSLAESLTGYIKRSVAASAQAAKAINQLDELLESGFKGREVEFVTQMIEELNEIEYDTDQMQIDVRQQLFNLEADLQPIDVMFLYRIIEKIGIVADCAEQAGHRLQMLAAG